VADPLQLAVEVPRREVLRCMGYPRGHEPGGAIARAVEPLWAQAAALVRACGAFVRAGRAEAEAVGMPAAPDRAAFGLCTVGPGLERESERRMAGGDALGALFFDAFGSAAAEAAAEALHARICAGAQAEGLVAERRVSPGYGRWDVVRQRDLLARLPADRLGVSLTEGCMMVPRKSVSFALALGTSGEQRPRARCASCDLVDCRYRVADAPDAPRARRKQGSP
jgi:hypothetical protein